MGRVMKCGMVCECLECQIPIEEECPPTLPSPDSDEVMEERQRQAMLDDIMAQARGEAQ